MSKARTIIEIYSRVGEKDFGYSCPAECMEQFLASDERREQLAKFFEEMAVACREKRHPFRLVGT